MLGTKAEEQKSTQFGGLQSKIPSILLYLHHCLMLFIQVLGPTVFCHHQPALNDQAETPTLKFAHVEEDPARIFTNHKIEEVRKCDALLALLNLNHVIFYCAISLCNRISYIKDYWLSILEKPKTVYTSISTLHEAPCSQPLSNQTVINSKIKMQIDGIKLLIHCFHYMYSKKFPRKQLNF